MGYFHLAICLYSVLSAAFILLSQSYYNLFSFSEPILESRTREPVSTRLSCVEIIDHGLWTFLTDAPSYHSESLKIRHLFPKNTGFTLFISAASFCIL